MKFITVLAIFIGTALTLSAGESVSATNMATKEVLFTKESHPQLHCLALNIYHEARADNIAGRYAVADVVLNRVHDDRWPSTICDVVKQGPISEWWLKEKGKKVPIRHKCQFSWYCDGKDDTPHDKVAWRDSQEIAYKLYHLGVFRGISEGATHYHATYVDPNWNKRMQNVGRIGAHLFFRAP